MYVSFRSRHGGLGTTSVSLHAATIAAVPRVYVGRIHKRVIETSTEVTRRWRGRVHSRTLLLASLRGMTRRQEADRPAGAATKAAIERVEVQQGRQDSNLQPP